MRLAIVIVVLSYVTAPVLCYYEPGGRKQLASSRGHKEHKSRHRDKDGHKRHNRGHEGKSMKEGSYHHEDDKNENREADDVRKNKKGHSWNNFGETEKIVKDRGHGFIKSFSWDREHIVKDKWGKKGNKYDEGYEKKRKKETIHKRKKSGGKKKKMQQVKEMDNSVWTGADHADDQFAGLSWQDLHEVQALL